MRCFIGHDLGTGGNKTVLANARGEVLATHLERYPLHHPAPGHVEQEPEDWWRAVCVGTREVLAKAKVAPSAVEGLAFAGQMLTLVPMDRTGAPTRRALSWMDARAGDEARRIVRRLGGERIVHRLAGASPSGKDLVAKVAWLAAHEPSTHIRTAAYGDATSFLVARATGHLSLDATAAGATGLLDVRTRTWSRLLMLLTAWPLAKTPALRRSTDVVGRLTDVAARALGLGPHVVVAAGMADVPAAAVGSGAVRDGDAHVYLGSSAWIGVTTREARSIPRAGIACVPSADPHLALLIGESETAGVCRDWAVRELGLGGDFEAGLAASPPGSNGLLFCPWMYGERAPIHDADVRGAFVNVALTHTRDDLARAVVEGVCLNLAWILDELAAAGNPCPSLRAIGGGAASDAWLQALADATGRCVERVERPQEAGALGAALVAAVATGYGRRVDDLRDCVTVERTFAPRPEFRAVYARAGATLRGLHGPLSRASKRLAASPA